MVKWFVALLGVVAVSGVLTAAQQKPTIKQEVIPRTSVTDAKGMFNTYCATCHGLTGKGDGPAAVALKKAPADLTKITERNGGKFPDVKVSRYIQGLDEFPAHGSRDMPIWGDLFRSLDGNSQQAVAIRVNGLVAYLKGLQQ